MKTSVWSTPRGFPFHAFTFAFFAMPAFAGNGDDANPVLIATCVLAMMVPTMWFMYRAYENSHFFIRIIRNDDSTDIAHFKDVLRHAKTELLIHDDGDQDDGAMYNNDDVVEAVRKRMTECKELEIRCLLNFNRGLKMTELSREFGDRFSVRYLRRRSSQDVHFKIADRGRWAYLSARTESGFCRNSEVCDGTHANGRVRRRYVGDLVAAFETEFEHAHSS